MFTFYNLDPRPPGSYNGWRWLHSRAAASGKRDGRQKSPPFRTFLFGRERDIVEGNGYTGWAGRRWLKRPGILQGSKRLSAVI